MALTETHVRGAVAIPDRVSNVHPEHWVRKIHDIEMAYPLMFMMKKKQKTESVTYNWWEQPTVDRSIDILDVYTDAGLSSAYASGGALGDTLYFSCTAANARKVREWDALTIVTGTTNAFRSAQVTSVNVASDTTSYIAARLDQADTSNTLAEATPTALLSNAHPEKADTAPALFADAYQWTNNIQRFQEAFELTEAEMHEAERVDPNIRARAEKQALDRLVEAQFFAFLLGRRVTTATGFGRLWKTQGFIPAMEDNESGQVYNYKTDSTYSGQTFAQGGLDWMETIGEVTSRKKEDDGKTVLLSSLAMRHIQNTIRENTQYQFSFGENRYGMKVNRLVMPGGHWDFIVDQMFSKYAELRKTAIVYEPHLLEKMVFLPRKYTKDPNTNPSILKGNWSEYCGLRWNNLEACAVLKNIGETNTA